MQTRTGVDRPADSALRSGVVPGEAGRNDPLGASLAQVLACNLSPGDPIICVGGASEPLAEALLARGFEDITIIDPSRGALERLAEHLRAGSNSLTLLHQYVTRFRPHQRYAVWHDAGSFHYLTHPDDRQEYLEVLQQALRPEGHLVIATLGPQGPQHIDGVPLARYSATTLLEELGWQFELAEHCLIEHRTASGEAHQYLHGRFRRHAPRWPH